MKRKATDEIDVLLLESISYIPVIIIQDDGEIVWNSEIINAFKREEIIGKNISEIFKDINLKEILESKELSINERIRYKDRVYDIDISSVENNCQKYIILNLHDITDSFKKENKECVFLIEVDNLNEALETTEENNTPLVVAEVERAIKLYAHGLKAMIKKYDTNKYVLTVPDKYVDKEIEQKFKILEEISKIDCGNKLEITLSIGIGRGGITPLENSNFAKIAMELALGRGGDQVVIKDSEDIKFFGGNTKELEKRTRVRARVVSHALKNLIYESSNVFIIGHKTPDMDCFGSAVALSSIVKKIGKECDIILKDDTKPIEYFLNKLKKYKEYKDRFITLDEANNRMNDDTLIIVVDVHNKSYISDFDIVKRARRKVIIDHHRRSPDIIEGAILTYIEVYASSTAEMITEMIQYISEDVKLTQIEAEGLLAGIYMDTKSFSFKTGVRTFEAASYLRDQGAETIEVKKMFNATLEDYLLIAEIIKSAKVRNKVAVAICPRKNADTVIIAKAADELLNISGIKVSFVLEDINGDISISGRSAGDINVQVVLEALGGGGHMNIAGAKVCNSTMDEVIVQLNKAIKKYLRIGE